MSEPISIQEKQTAALPLAKKDGYVMLENITKFVFCWPLCSLS